MKIAGLDIGTTGCKLTVFDESGKQLGKAYRDYPVRRAVSGHEIDISTMMESVYSVLGEMAARYPDIAGIGVTSFGETFVLVDEVGNPLHPAMLYTDPRGAEECRELTEKLGADRIARITGLQPYEMYSISKLMWLRRNKPEIYAAAKRVHLIEDYVVWHLTGKAQIDYFLATRTMAFDINTLTWSREIFDAAGIDPALMSNPVPTGSAAGTVTAAAQQTGLRPDCIIVSVSHDQVAAAIGAGAFDGSVAVDGAGTVECLTPVYDSLPEIDVMRKGFFSVVPYVVPVPDKYLIGEVEMLPNAAFEKIQAAPMENHSEIARHGDQGVDLQSGNIITLLLVNDANMDGMLFDVGCHGRCVSAAYLPGIRAAIEYQLMGMVKRLVYDTIETTQNPDCTVPWKKLSKQLGFAVTEQNGLWSVIEETLDEMIDVRGYNLTTDGIELNLEPMACDIMQDDDQGFSIS